METAIPKVGEYVRTPRFLRVKIAAVISEKQAEALGFMEPTHLDGKPYEVRGRSLGVNRMEFAIVIG